MVRYTEPVSGLGARILKYRKANKFTQAQLAQRYGVSGPAIFKFEKGFVRPSFKLWQKMAADIGIPEKEAVLLWVKEQLPPRHHFLIGERVEADWEPFQRQLEDIGATGNGHDQMRQVIAENPEISPGLKVFVAEGDYWDILRPTPLEIIFLIALDAYIPLMTSDQYRDALVLGREIQTAEEEEGEDGEPSAD